MGRTLGRLLVVAVVFGLGTLVAFLLAQLNARTFRLEREGNELRVLKGRMFPIGTIPYRPGDPALADAYAPVPLDGADVPGGILEQRFGDRDDLDRALFDVISPLARSRLASEDPAVLERGLYYIRRLEHLSGVTEEQHLQLQRMQADVAYYLARIKLDDARKKIAEGLAQLKIAADSDNRHARNAHQMITEVEPAARALEEALRRAVHTLSAPNSVEAPPPEKAAPASSGKLSPPSMMLGGAADGGG